MRVIVLASLVVTAAAAPHLAAFAQQSKRPSFEVASIKPGDPNERRRGMGTRGIQFEALNSSLKDMIAFAYDVKDHQIFGGPKWIDSDRFTIEARQGAAMALPDPDLNRRVGFNRLIQLMLQSLMEDRFKLALHRETRTEPIYELVVAKGGSKLQASAGPDANGHQRFASNGAGLWIATNQGIGALVGVLSQQLGRPVRDKTGLTDRYDFKLTYTPELAQQVPGALPREGLPDVDSNAPSVFTALQEQLGLKLESTRGPVEVLVIDNAERPEPN